MRELIKDFSRQHNFYKTVTIISALGMVISVLLSVYFNYKLTTEKNSVTYVVQNGMVYKAVSAENFSYPERKYEVIQAAKEFHLNRYSGDRYSYKINIKNALELCGDCSKDILVDYEDEGMARNISERDWTFTAYIDSVKLVDDYSGYVFGRQAIRTNSHETLRNLYFSFEARSVSRSDNNLLGVVIDHIEVFNNKVLETTRY